MHTNPNELHSKIAASTLGFRKSTFCAQGGCVEIAKHPDGTVFVRDSKDLSKTFLAFTSSEWIAFVKGVKNGEFDLEAH